MDKSNHKRPKLLVVDHEKNYRVVFARLFEGAGYQVFLADSAESAMALLRNENVALILTDLQVSGMNGLDFCRRVRSEIGDIPTIAFTAEASGLDCDAMSSAGVLAWLDKPFDNRAIVSMVDDILLDPVRIACSPWGEKNARPLSSADVLQKEPEIP